MFRFIHSTSNKKGSALLRWTFSTLLLMLCACSGEDDVADVAPPAALYSPTAQYPVEVTFKEGVKYNDILGAERSLNLAIYRPIDAPSPMPVVIFSHGGSNGKNNPQDVLAPWPETIASAGYLAIGIAHPARKQASYDALCDHLGVSEDITCALKINWDRPHDVTRVINWLEEQVDDTFDGVADLTKIAHFGHSAGAGCAMMLAGAPRNYLCSQPFGMNQGEVVSCDPDDLVSKVDTRVKAIIALSPQGPGADGFMTESFATVDIPVMIGTGANDGDAGEPLNRRDAFEQLDASPNGDERFMIYLDSEGAKHTLFQGNLDKCAEQVDMALCTQMREWLLSSTVAFLDHTFQDRAKASTWLTTGGPSGVSAGTAEWSQK